MDVPARIEHTVLGPETTWPDVETALETAAELGTRVCVPPCYVAEAAAFLGREGEERTDATGETAVPLVTVVGFPHGQHTTGVKCQEATEAWEAGADELDVVMNVGRLLAGEDEAVTADLAEVVAAVPVPVKVIVEAPLLDEPALRRACEAAVAAEADFLKTATGFTEGGATVADVAVMSEYLPVKASGGVGSWAAAERMLEAGAERIGASGGDTIVREYRAARAETEAGTDGDGGTDASLSEFATGERGDEQGDGY
jgi:deoxyribose-phosphate aldolase